ncbi:YicC family protein [bacterium]|nr:YicC family protein [bacterium]
MAHSMTGIGVGEFRDGGTVYTVEIRSVNNRFLDISCRLPNLLIPFEGEIKELIRDRVQRGKIYVTVGLSESDNGAPEIKASPEKIRSVSRWLEEIRVAAGIRDPIRLEHLLQFSEILQPASEGPAEPHTWEGMKRALVAALDAFQAMRAREAGILIDDIRLRVRNLEAHMAAIESLAKDHVVQVHAKWRERVREMLKPGEIPEDRAYAELAMLADRMDITEECIRMRSHIQVFQETISGEKAVGKKLTFLLQEMNREGNTIGSKACSAAISQQVVLIKDELEKIREQAQNLE